MSKADINKIADLILSDCETNQELGMMMAVSQGVKDEVLKECREKFIKLLNDSSYNSCDPTGKIVDYSNHYSTNLEGVFMVEAYFKRSNGVLSTITISNIILTKKAKTIRELQYFTIRESKNYNYEEK